MLGRIFGTGEREAERYVRGDCVLIADCFRRLDRGWEGKGVGEMCVNSRLC